MSTSVEPVINSLPKRKPLADRIVAHKYLFLMLLPGLLYFVIYRYIPMFGLVIAFKRYYPNLGVFGSEWVGLQHFQRVFSSPDILRVFRNTLIISFAKLIFAFPVPIILAILINEVRTMSFKRTVQTISYLPHFLSWVVFGEIILVLLSGDGPVNILRGLLGLDPVYFMIEPRYFRPIVVITDILKTSGWGTIVYLAAITTIDPQMYEAAIIDGANRFRRIIHITLPCITSTIAILLILRIGRLLDAGFHQIFVLYNEAVYETGDIFGTYVYRVGLSRGEYSLATAVGMFKGVVGFILIVLANKVSRRITESGIW